MSKEHQSQRGSETQLMEQLCLEVCRKYYDSILLISILAAFG